MIVCSTELIFTLSRFYEALHLHAFLGRNIHDQWDLYLEVLIKGSIEGL